MDIYEYTMYLPCILVRTAYTWHIPGIYQAYTENWGSRWRHSVSVSTQDSDDFTPEPPASARVCTSPSGRVQESAWPAQKGQESNSESDPGSQLPGDGPQSPPSATATSKLRLAAGWRFAEQELVRP